jgi:hypothetical protein
MPVWLTTILLPRKENYKILDEAVSSEVYAVEASCWVTMRWQLPCGRHLKKSLLTESMAAIADKYVEYGHVKESLTLLY